MYPCHMPVLLQFSIALTEQGANCIEYFDDVTYFSFAYNYPWKILPVYLIITIVIATFLNVTIEQKGRKILAKLR